MPIVFDPTLPLTVEIKSNGVRNGIFGLALWGATQIIMHRNGSLHDKIPDIFPLPFINGSSAINDGLWVVVTITDTVPPNKDFVAEVIFTQNNVLLSKQPTPYVVAKPANSWEACTITVLLQAH